MFSFKNLTKLCSPAIFYFTVSMLFIFIALIQNLGNTKSYKLWHYSASVSSTIFIFALKLIYIFFWTWLLNLICKDGHSGISWILVFLPIILLALLMISLLIGL